jgi:predicted nucleotidyltransferase
MASRTVSQAFDVFFDRLIPTASQQAAKAKHRASVESSLRNALSVSEFRETGSFTHGTGIKAYSDVDLLVSLSNAKPGTSDIALSWVKSALSNSFPYTIVQVSRPAVVVRFAGGDETWEVIPAFITSRGGKDQFVYDIPGPASGWIDSAPGEHLKYVNECNTRAGMAGAAKKLARLAKAWKYYNNVTVSSFYLEMRAAEHVTTQSSFIPVWDICQLLESLDGNQLAAMNDPKGASGRFQPCSSDSKKIEALSKLSTGATRARKALDADQKGNAEDAFYCLNLLFGGQFPSRHV